MAITLHYTNRIDASGVVFTASSAQTDLPASNVANAQRTRVWRTGSSTAAETLVMDLLTAQAITAVIILDHTLTAGDSLIKIQGNASDSWGAPSFSSTFTWASSEMYKTFAAETYRYWRFIFTKSAAGETRDIGRIYLGSSVDLGRDPDHEGYAAEDIDRSITHRSVGGQTYSLSRDSYIHETYKFTKISNTVKGQLTTLAAAVGTHTPWFCYFDGVMTVPRYVKLGALLKQPVSGGITAALVWDMELETNEEL